MAELGLLAVGLLVAGALLAALSAVLLGTLAKPGTRPLRAGHAALRNLDHYVDKRHHFLVKGAATTGATLFAIGVVLIVFGAFGQ